MNTIYENGNLSVDILNAENGNFTARVKNPSRKRQKIRIIKDGILSTYDLDKGGKSELYPLQNGDGNYLVRLYENTTGNKYLFKGSVIFPVKLTSPDACLHVPNQYINYSDESEFVKIAKDICREKTPEEKYHRICEYVTDHFKYDYVRALTVKPGMLPDLDRTFKKKMGICQDLAGITVAMLRSQGIASKLDIGWADSQYHAWVTTKIGETSYFFDPTLSVTVKKRINHYTVERWY